MLRHAFSAEVARNQSPSFLSNIGCYIRGEFGHQYMHRTLICSFARALFCNGSVLNASSIIIFTIWVILSTTGVTSLSHAAEMKQNGKRLNLSGNDLEELPPGVHEYAAVQLSHGIFLGARATINVWNSTVISPEVSISQIWVTSGSGENINSVEAGVLVDSRSPPVNKPRIFVYWTNDSYRTGCYDLQCAGFVLTGRRFRPGNPLELVSIFGGGQSQISIAITKGGVTGNWWLRIENENVGYWPRALFTSLSSHAEAIQWGGEIINTEPHGQHTKTEMGSGHFPSEGYGKASFFRNLRFVDDKSIEKDPANLQKIVTRPECYDLRLNVDAPSVGGVNFYYGGPGYSPRCEK